jgi:hypothetical protein
MEFDLSEKKSVNFGGGLELLMNDKINTGGSGKPSSDIDLDDLTNLENELNNLVEEVPQNINFSNSKYDPFSFTASTSTQQNDSSPVEDYKPSFVQFNDTPQSLGQATMDSTNPSGIDEKTWDGYTKFNNIPINPDKVYSQQPHMSKEELLREKFKYLKKLEALEKKGVDLSKKYTMESPLAEMQGEFETIMEEKQKMNSIKFNGNMLMAIVNGIEFLNNRFDPFDIKLDGWSDQINENLEDYDDVFAELHEKYKSRASMAPELKLLFQLGGSAMMVHMTNTMFKSAMPGMDDILRQNPDLMNQFQAAAVNSIGQTNPGMAGFMGGLLNPQPEHRGPPPPLNTQPNKSYMARPDLNYSAPQTQQQQPYVRNHNFVDDTSIRLEPAIEKSSRFPPQRPEMPPRPEMKGPPDINDILSGLKTKTINIPSASFQEPKTPRRRNNNSERNSISLDI